MHELFKRLASFSVRYRWAVIGVWLAGTVAAVNLLPSLTSVIKNDNADFLPASAPSVQAANLAKPLVGSSNQDVFVVAANPSGEALSRADLAAVQREARLLARVPYVVSAKILGESLNRKAAQIIVRANISLASDTPAKTLISRIIATFHKASPPPGLVFHTAGSLADQVAIDEKTSSSGARTQDISLIFIIVLLLLVFRSVLAPIATLLPPALVLTMAGPVIAFIAEHSSVKISTVTQLLLIVLILGAGTDYGLFLVFRVREEMRRGRVGREAVVAALSRVGESITFSAATVIVALLSLLAASFGFYHDLGIPLALGVTMMLLAGLTLTPALLAVLAPVLFWPVTPKVGHQLTGFWGRVAQRAIRKPIPTLVVGLVVFGALAIASLGNHASGFGGATTAPAGSDAAKGDAILKADYPEASANPTTIVFRFRQPIWSPGGLQRVRRAEDVLVQSHLFTNLLGPLDPAGFTIPISDMLRLHELLGAANRLPAIQPHTYPISLIPSYVYQAYRSTVELISEDGRTIAFEASLRAGDPGSTAAMDAVPAMRAVTRHAVLVSGAEAGGVTGEAPGLYDVSHTSSQDLAHIVPIAIAVIGVLLALLLRSLVAPLYLIASVGLSYLAALGVAVVIFMDIGGASGLTFILPFLMFIFLLALGEDYNILVMSRIREEALSKPLRQAVADAIGVTGTTVTSAGVVLAGTFAIFAVAGAVGPGASQVRDVGWGLAIGVLMDTFLVRSIFVPSIAVLLGRFNWWPSRLARPTAPTADNLEAPSEVAASAQTS